MELLFNSTYMTRTQSEQIVREVVIQAVPEIGEECSNCKWERSDGYVHKSTRIGNRWCRKTVTSRPIRLADVLLAMEKAGYRESFTSLLDLEWSGCWNLRADSLSEQSPETLQFLAELLTN